MNLDVGWGRWLILGLFTSAIVYSALWLLNGGAVPRDLGDWAAICAPTVIALSIHALRRLYVASRRNRAERDDA